jgi:hypothetical protein
MPFGSVSEPSGDSRLRGQFRGVYRACRWVPSSRVNMKEEAELFPQQVIQIDNSVNFHVTILSLIFRIFSNIIVIFSAIKPENQGRRSRRTKSWDSNKITTPGSQAARLTAIQELMDCVKRLDFYLDTLNLDEPGP